VPDIFNERITSHLHWTMYEASRTAVWSWHGIVPVSRSRFTCNANRYLQYTQQRHIRLKNYTRDINAAERRRHQNRQLQ